MMKRRSFLARTTGGMAAAFAELNWEAPEKPPRFGEGDEFLPIGWADCRIDGREHALKEIVGCGAGHRGVGQIEMTLWAEGERLDHLRRLERGERIVPIEIRFAREEKLPVFFDGRIFGLGPWDHDDIDVPAIKASVLVKNLRRTM